jgi:hypothetical protein
LLIGDIGLELDEDFASPIARAAGCALDGWRQLAGREEGSVQECENGKAAGKKRFHDWIGRLIVGTVMYSRAAQRSFTESNDASGLNRHGG